MATAIDITKEEAWEHVMAGADNVMTQNLYCEDETCEGTDEDPCWMGIQKGDEEPDGEWPPHWQRFQLWL